MPRGFKRDPLIVEEDRTQEQKGGFTQDGAVLTCPLSRVLRAVRASSDLDLLDDTLGSIQAGIRQSKDLSIGSPKPCVALKKSH